jgi:hypothetical protein
MEVLKNKSFTRRQYDGCKTTDDLRVTTGPGRYQIGTPPQYATASFAPEPTIRQQMWGASLNSQFIKTDVESDLLNLNRPTTKTICNQYDPTTDKINQAEPETMKEESFPQTFSRLVDPPCTMRSTGWNRWEWLCENPQENVMMPFDNNITSRLQQKDQYRPCLPTPMGPTAVLPTPSANMSAMGGLLPGPYSNQQAAASRNAPETNVRTVPAQPSIIPRSQIANRNPPSMGFAPINYMARA